MKTLLILGGSGNIGSTIIERFKKAGYKIIAPTRQELDLEDRSSIEKYLKNINLKYVDVLIHCAGFNEPKPIEEVTLLDIDKTNAVNVLSFCQIVKYFVPGLKEKKNGYILAISSIYGIFSRAKRLPYAMSKHALNGVIQTLALELGPFNIKVNALSPGFVDTKMTRKNNDVKTIRDFEEKIPLGRLASTKDIANVAYFLCSPENTYINGQNIIVDGGYSIGGFQK